MLIRPFRQADMQIVRELLRQLGYEVAADELTSRLARVRAAGSIALHTRHAQAFYGRLGYVNVSTSDLMRKTVSPVKRS